MKSWETMVENSKEPNVRFKGVYCFRGDGTIGEGVKREAILWKPRIYAVNFTQKYVIRECPLIYSFFTSVIYNSMINNQPNPVYGKHRYSIIKTRKSVHKHLLSISEWDFYYYNGNIARKGSLVKRFNDLNCYLIEEAFDKNFETNWDEIKTGFINEIRTTIPNPINSKDEKNITPQIINNLLRFCFMIYCRSPEFDPLGMYSWLESFCKGALLGKKDIEEIKNTFWHIELYRMSCENNKGFYSTIIKETIKRCQIIVIEAYPNEGDFITSDNPAFMHISKVESENNNGFYFPIDPKYLLLLARGDGNINTVKHRMADNALIKKLNRIIASHKTEVLVADKKNLGALL